MDTETIEGLCNLYGSVQKFSEAVDVSRQTVYTWLKTGVSERTWPWVKSQIEKHEARRGITIKELIGG